MSKVTSDNSKSKAQNNDILEKLILNNVTKEQTSIGSTEKPVRQGPRKLLPEDIKKMKISKVKDEFENKYNAMKDSDTKILRTRKMWPDGRPKSLTKSLLKNLSPSPQTNNDNFSINLREVLNLQPKKSIEKSKNLEKSDTLDLNKNELNNLENKLESDLKDKLLKGQFLKETRSLEDLLESGLKIEITESVKKEKKHRIPEVFHDKMVMKYDEMHNPTYKLLEQLTPEFKSKLIQNISIKESRMFKLEALILEMYDHG